MRRWSGLRLLFHCLGLSAMGAALFLEGLVLISIFEHGYFTGIEQNMTVLYSETILAAFGTAYLLHLVWRFVASAS